VRFDRVPTGGTLTPAGCVIDNDASFDSCAVASDGLDNATTVAPSADGVSVYVAAQADDAIARFDRALVPEPPPVGPSADPPAADPPPADPPPAAPCDTEPPETTITKTPKRKTGRRKAKYRFESDEPGSSFECKLDKKPFQVCSSPYKKVALAFGTHRFRVHAIDPAGNPDPTDATFRWKVRRPD
jgi:hypothetical protein